MVNLKLVNHVNLLSVADEGSEIFCKRDHTVEVPDLKSCSGCPYFAGAGHMDCRICQWEDVPPLGTEDYNVATKVVANVDAQRELFRVSKLIDAKVLTRG